jgi:hypothetical protein
MKKINFLLAFFYILFISYSSYARDVIDSSSESPEQGCVVFLDTSLSMRGFFSPSNQEASVIQKFLQTEFRNYLSENDLHPIYLSYFGSKVSTPQPLQDNVNIGDRFIYNSDSKIKEFFSSGSSNITGIFKNEEFSKYSVSVIITDGVQYTTDGFDIGKMIKTIKSKTDEGIHISLLGLKSEFDGFVFPVLTAYPAPFWHKGMKPIYIWLATRDVRTEINLKGDMAKRIKRFTEDFKIANLSDFKLTNTSMNFEVGAVTVSLSLRKSTMRIESEKSDANPKYCMVIPRPKKDHLELRLRNDVNIPILNKGSTDINTVYYKIEMNLEPEVNWAKITEYENEGRWSLSLIYDKIPRRNNNLKIKIIATPVPEKWWWQQWSTEADNSREDADKTLYLKRFGEQTIEPLYNKKLEIGFINLKIIKNK